MAATGLETFDKTLNVTNLWLDEIAEEVGPDRRKAWHVLGGVLRVVRDRVPTELSAHLGAELPLLVRGTYYDQFRPEIQPEVTRTREAFLDRVEQALAPVDGVDPEAACKAVFHVLDRHIDAGQCRKVREALPKDVQELWQDGGGPVS